MQNVKNSSSNTPAGNQALLAGSAPAGYGRTSISGSARRNIPPCTTSTTMAGQRDTSSRSFARQISPALSSR